MPEYRKADAPKEWHPTKFDGFTLVKTEHPYRCQKGSGRERCFALAEHGMKVGDWTKKCAEAGFDPKFVTSSLDKLSGTNAPGWTHSDVDDQGRTWEDVKKIRDEDPAKKEEREARKEAKRQEKERKAAAKAAKENKPRKPKAQAAE